MSWALAEVGRPGPARDVLDGGDVDPMTGRLLSVGELQAALRAARSAATRRPRTDQGPAGQELSAATPARPPAARTPAPAPAPIPAQTSGPGMGSHADAASAGPGVLRPPAGRRWVAVAGAHHGAGTSTVALALADAAATAGWPVHLVSCHPPAECGLLGAATVELGTDPAGAWRTGRRGAGVTVTRPAAGLDLASLNLDSLGLAGRGPVVPGGGPAWPAVPLGVDEPGLLTVVDTEAGAARAPQLLATAAAVLLVCRVSIPGVRQAEQLLGLLPDPDPAGGPAGVLLAAVGPARWPGPVRGATGPLLRELQHHRRVVAVPLDRHLATRGLTGGELPRPVLRAGQALLRLLGPALPAGAATGMTRTDTAAAPAGRTF